MKRVVAWALGALLAMAQLAWGEEDQDAALAAEFRKIGLTEQQAEPFREVLRGYYEERSGLFRRLERRGGDTEVRAARELRLMATRTSEAMSDVLTEQQLPHFTRYLELLNESFMARSRLR